DIYNIEYIKDVSKKLLTFKNLIDISEGYFYLLENVYLDMMELMEDLSYYKLGQDQYKQELTQILELFEQDLEEEKLNLEEVLQASY
ncbi:MAG: exonuclease, partial [Paraclostridium bifermentans]